MLHHYNIFMDSRHVDNNSTNKLKEKQFHLFNVHAMILIQCWSFKLFNLIFKSFLNYFKGFVLVRNQIVPVNQFNCNLVKHISKMVLRKDEAVLIWTVSKIETFFLFFFLLFIDLHMSVWQKVMIIKTKSRFQYFWRYTGFIAVADVVQNWNTNMRKQDSCAFLWLRVIKMLSILSQN